MTDSSTSSTAVPETSRVARLHGARDIRVAEEAFQDNDSGLCVVQHTSIGVCGSDLHYFKEGRIGEDKPEGPFVLGHEPAARVVRGAAGLEPGTRVYVEPGEHCGKCEFCERGDINLCQDIVFLGSFPVEGAYRDLYAYPPHLLLPLPDEMTDDQGALIEPLAVAVHAVNLGKPKLGERSAVIGCGGVGLLVLLTLKAMGIREVLVYDPVPGRLARAVELGGTAIADIKAAQGAYTVFEATDHSSGPRVAVDIAHVGADVVLIGIPEGDDYSFDAHEARRKALTLWVVRRSRLTTQRSIELVRDGLIQPEAVVSHHYELADIPKAMTEAADRIPGLTKAIIRFDGASA